MHVLRVDNEAGLPGVWSSVLRGLWYESLPLMYSHQIAAN